VDPGLQRVLLRVLLIGGVIGIASTAALIIAFRSFGERESGGPGRKPFIILVAAIAFILIACLVLVVFSLPTRS